MNEEKDVIGYVAVFMRNEHGICYVEFPDLPGCYTQGDTIEMAICNAQEALAIYYQERKGKMPKRSTISAIQEKYPNDVIQLVVFSKNDHIEKSRRVVKKTLTIPEWLNEVAVKYQVNFSLILKNALINHLKNQSDVSQYDKILLKD